MNFLLQLAECMTNVVAVLASLLLGYLVCSHWTWMHLQRRPLPRSRLEGFGNENLSKKVVIIGSGVSGLVTAKMFVQYGFRDVLVLEQHGDLGGVWRENYCGAAVQGPYWWYYFADFPWPKSILNGVISPTLSQVKAYLHLYAASFGISQCIRYHHRVTSLHRSKKQKWVVHVMTQEKAVHTIHADVLIVAGGNNDKQQKWIPTNLPDQDRFQGKIYHSSDVTTADMLQSMRNIVVVGGSKSAYDIATLYPEKTSLVMRNPHYFGRRWLLLPPYVDRLVYFMEHHFRIHREERSMLYRFLEAALWIFSIRLNPPKNLSVMEDILRGGGFQVSSTHAQFLKAQRLESIHTASIARFTRDGVVLTTGENLKADAVVFGTGFRPIQGGIHHILSAMHKSGWILQDEKWWEDGVYLHRYMYHPKMPDCYWIGFKDPNSTTCLTCNAQALWAVHCAAGRIVLPDSMEIAQTLEKRRSFAKTQLPASHRRAQYDYLGVDCDYSYAKSIVQECGLGDRLPSWWCRPFSRWSATGDFAAAFAAKPCTARAMVALESVSESLIEEDDDDSVSMCLDENGKSAGLVAAGHGSLTLTNDTGSLSSSDRTF